MLLLLGQSPVKRTSSRVTGTCTSVKFLCRENGCAHRTGSVFPLDWFVSSLKDSLMSFPHYRIPKSYVGPGSLTSLTACVIEIALAHVASGKDWRNLKLNYFLAYHAYTTAHGGNIPSLSSFISRCLSHYSSFSSPRTCKVPAGYQWDAIALC